MRTIRRFFFLALLSLFCFDGPEVWAEGSMPPSPKSGNFEGMWSGSESGWGLNITQQGFGCLFRTCNETLFVTWFTYDDEGEPMWLVISSATNTGNLDHATYSGVLHRATGPSFRSEPWRSQDLELTQVGTATLIFTDADNGRFEALFWIGSEAQYVVKRITRYVFASPVPRCHARYGPRTVANYTDMWLRSPAGSEAGWGVNITHQGDVLFATWFTYRDDGEGDWLVISSAPRIGNRTYAGTIHRARGFPFYMSGWSPEDIELTAVGTATFQFADDDHGTFAYTLDGFTGSKPITRYVFASPPTLCE